MKYTWTLPLSIAAVLFLGGCGAGPKPAARGDFVYHGHDFGPHRNAEYRAGVVDGCRTADGDYAKDHARFKIDIDYHDGWEHGRLHCKGKH
jgi:hypothetical protein